MRNAKLQMTTRKAAVGRWIKILGIVEFVPGNAYGQITKTLHIFSSMLRKPLKKRTLK